MSEASTWCKETPRVCLSEAGAPASFKRPRKTGWPILVAERREGRVVGQDLRKPRQSPTPRGTNRVSHLLKCPGGRHLKTRVCESPVLVQQGVPHVRRRLPPLLLPSLVMTRMLMPTVHVAPRRMAAHSI